MASGTRTCVILRPGDSYEGKQGISYDSGISAESVGAERLCMHLLEIPPNGRARAHLHENHETAIFVLSGDAEMWWGDELEEYATMGAGDLIYIPPGVPHLPGNRSDTEPCRAVVARTDPNEQESVVLLSDLEGKATRPAAG
jgi:uncharacterized RmlC-like cupin family protein